MDKKLKSRFIGDMFKAAHEAVNKTRESIELELKGSTPKVYEKLIMQLERGEPVRLDQAEAVVKTLGYDEIPKHWFLASDDIPELSNSEASRYYVVPETKIIELKYESENADVFKIDYRSVKPEDRETCLEIGDFIAERCSVECEDDHALSAIFDAAVTSEEKQRKLEDQGLSIFVETYQWEYESPVGIHIVITRAEDDPMIRVSGSKRVFLKSKQGFDFGTGMEFGPLKDLVSELKRKEDLVSELKQQSEVNEGARRDAQDQLSEAKLKLDYHADLLCQLRGDCDEKTKKKIIFETDWNSVPDEFDVPF